jgi:hypothetical protein
MHGLDMIQLSWQAFEELAATPLHRNYHSWKSARLPCSGTTPPQHLMLDLPGPDAEAMLPGLWMTNLHTTIRKDAYSLVNSCGDPWGDDQVIMDEIREMSELLRISVIRRKILPCARARTIMDEVQSGIYPSGGVLTPQIVEDHNLIFRLREFALVEGITPSGCGDTARLLFRAVHIPDGETLQSIVAIVRSFPAARWKELNVPRHPGPFPG